jgi:hypothetical protein
MTCFEVRYGPLDYIVIAAHEDRSLDVRRGRGGMELDQHFDPGHRDHAQWWDFFADDVGKLGKPCRNPWRD